MSIMIGAVLTILIFLFRNAISHLYYQSNEVMAQKISKNIIFVALYMFFDCQRFGLVGIIRGLGK